jgi:integrase
MHVVDAEMVPGKQYVRSLRRGRIREGFASMHSSDDIAALLGRAPLNNLRGDRPLSNKLYTVLAAAAGIRRITSHGSRHTAGSSYAVMDAGQKIIASLLGNADTAVSERYAHVALDATAPLVEARWARLRFEVDS